MNDWIDIGLRIAGGLGIPSLALYFLRDRRKVKAEERTVEAGGQVAERTVNATVAKADAGAIEAHLLAVEHAFTMERQSKDRQIAGLTEELGQVRAQLAESQQLAASLRAQVDETTGKLGQVTAQMEELRRMLARLTNTTED